MTPQDILEAWGLHLSLARRRSPHTVRAYLATATRLLAALPPAQGWASLARLDPATLRTHLAARRADGSATPPRANCPRSSRSSPSPASNPATGIARRARAARA
jgi:site-specific recombinase XerC